MTRKYSPCWIKSNSDKRFLFSVENQKKHHVIMCSVKIVSDASENWCTRKLAHQKIGAPGKLVASGMQKTCRHKARFHLQAKKLALKLLFCFFLDIVMKFES